MSNISTAYDQVVSAFQGEVAIEIDISGLCEADLTFIQLLESARRTAAASGRAFHLRQAASGSVLQVLQRGGFLDPDDRDRSDFWLSGVSSQ